MGTKATERILMVLETIASHMRCLLLSLLSLKIFVDLRHTVIVPRETYVR